MGIIFRKPAQKNWEGKKRPKFGAIFDNFRLLSRISRSGTTPDIQNRKEMWSTAIPSAFHVIQWTLVHKQKKVLLPII